VTVAAALPSDPLWPRAAHWIAAPVAGSTQGSGVADFALLGVGTYRTSITPTKAHATPAAIREALLAYSTYSASRDVDVATLTALDLGDVSEPDGAQGEARVAAAIERGASRCRFLVALGGDNSLTFSVVNGLFRERLAHCGLITIDAHHDLRDGISNGSVVRRLLEAGLLGSNTVQIGIADFSNSAAYAARAREAGITVISRASLRGASMAEVAARALDIAGAGGRPVFVDIDVDVCDRAEVPGCPAAAPGGISADELRELAFELACDSRVAGADLAEIDATIDANDRRTTRLAALLVLELAAGVASREMNRAAGLL
jgi:formiminoglutamase